MSKMTSSIHDGRSTSQRRQQATLVSVANSSSPPIKQHKQQKQEQHEFQPQQSSDSLTACNGQIINGATKVLTNFSIDSIIGCAELPVAARQSELASGANGGGGRAATAAAAAAAAAAGVDAVATCCTRPVGEIAQIAQEVAGILVYPGQDVSNNTRNNNNQGHKINDNNNTSCHQTQLSGNKMDSNQAINEHMINASNNNCNKSITDTTSTASTITQHQNSSIIRPTQHRPKVFRCAWCPLAFSNNGQLRNHERIHTGERPFRCEQVNCAKTFTRNEELTRHKLIHTGIRPHACSRCDKSFGRKDHLKKHERTHERKKTSKRAHGQRFNPIAQVHQQLQYQQSHLAQNQFIGHELDMFQPIKATIDYHQLTSPTANGQLSAALSPYHHDQHMSPHHPATSQPAHLQHCSPSAESISQTNLIPSGLLTSQIATLAAAVAATTSTAATTSLATALHPFTSAPLTTTQAIMTNAAAAAAAAAATSNPMQQLASDYWQQWCNLIDQQNQQQQQLGQTFGNFKFN